MPTRAYRCLLVPTQHVRQRIQLFWGGIYGTRGTIPFQNPVHRPARRACSQVGLRYEAVVDLYLRQQQMTQPGAELMLFGL